MSFLRSRILSAMLAIAWSGWPPSGAAQQSAEKKFPEEQQSTASKENKPTSKPAKNKTKPKKRRAKQKPS